MRVEELIWLDAIVEKLAVKHQVAPDEVEEVLRNKPKLRFVENGEREAIESRLICKVGSAHPTD
ncbi:hypothetical protein NIES4071_57810 [Calothrix sp. NIES-4071]|nr:hypothetical protein NIES4071_57810 [Calothrix sp. NIES-4071]BAZ60088.1 hypothetical protein NIES4105_57760 [Calothrix sp. NIES-4105]